MKTASILILLFLLALAGLLPSCGNTESEQPEAQPMVQDSLTTPEHPEPLVIFLDLGGAIPDCDAVGDAIELRLHGQIAWQAGSGFKAVAEDSATFIPDETLAYKFFSTRKVAELRIRDAIKLKWKTSSVGHLQMRLYRNEGHTWSMYHESAPLPCANADTLILEMLKLLAPIE